MTDVDVEAYRSFSVQFSRRGRCVLVILWRGLCSDMAGG